MASCCSMINAPRPRGPLIFLLCLAIWTSGCARPRILRQSELLKLDGFRAGEEVYLTDSEGKELLFTPNLRFTLVLRSGERIPARLIAIDIDDGLFIGKTWRKQVLKLRFDDILGAELLEPDTSDTAGTVLTAFVVLLGVAVVTALTLIVIVAVALARAFAANPA